MTRTRQVTYVILLYLAVLSLVCSLLLWHVGQAKGEEPLYRPAVRGNMIQVTPTDPPPQMAVTPWPWDALAQCESGGNWAINTGNGFYGGLQFTLQSWRGVGGAGYPHQASKSEQIHRAELLQDIQGWGAWPVCSRKVGLR
jgi:hypothetical protein